MKQPDDPRLWQGLTDRAAQRLPANFAESVLRSARQTEKPTAVALPFALSALTAAACLAVTLFVHNHNVRATNAQNLAEWHQLAVAVDTLNDL